MDYQLVQYEINYSVSFVFKITRTCEYTHIAINRSQVDNANRTKPIIATIVISTQRAPISAIIKIFTFV